MSTYLDKLIESVKQEINQELTSHSIRKKNTGSRHFEAPGATP
jgi:hypothetical protein